MWRESAAREKIKAFCENSKLCYPLRAFSHFQSLIVRQVYSVRHCFETLLFTLGFKICPDYVPKEYFWPELVHFLGLCVHSNAFLCFFCHCLKRNGTKICCVLLFVHLHWTPTCQACLGLIWIYQMSFIATGTANIKQNMRAIKRWLPHKNINVTILRVIFLSPTSFIVRQSQESMFGNFQVDEI